MADLVRLACYPFLPGVRAAVGEHGPAFGDLLGDPQWETTRRRGVKRIMGAITGNDPEPGFATQERDALQDLVSYGFAKMLLAALKDPHLTRRYAAREARRIAGILAGDTDDAVQDASDALRLGMRAETNPAATAQQFQAGAVPAGGMVAGIGGTGGGGARPTWRVHFADYVRHAPHEVGWKLVERRIERGNIDLTHKDAVRLVEHAWMRHLADDLAKEMARPLPPELLAGLQPYLDDIAPLLTEARENWSTGEFGKVRKELFPPCITELFEAMKRGDMIPHHGRFAMASFLATIGMTAEDIMEYFREIPNFDVEKSRYQITHIAGEQGVEKYTPPGCATMQTNGVCPLDKRDNLCMKIKHPLSYYRAQIRFREEDEKRAGKVMAAKKRSDERRGQISTGTPPPARPGGAA